MERGAGGVADEYDGTCEADTEVRPWEERFLLGAILLGSPLLLLCAVRAVLGFLGVW